MVGYRKILYSIGGLALLFLQTACAPLPEERFYQRDIQRFVGYPLDAVVQQWGPPQSHYVMDNGQQVYQWHRENREYFSSATIYPHYDPFWGATGWRWGIGSGYTHRPVVLEHFCTTQMITDASRIIRQIRYQGDDCVAYDRGPNRSYVAPLR